MYTLIRDLCIPDKPVTKSYEDLNKLIKDHLCPKPSEAMERCKFHQAAQLEAETVAQYAARLKNLSIHCNFPQLTTALRDQLICGIRDHDVRVELFAEQELTYDKAYKLATAREMAKKNTNNTSGIARENTTQQEVNVISSKGFLRGRRSEKGPRGRDRRAGSESASQAERSQENVCYCCGGPNHWARNCIHRRKRCDKCRRQGHLKHMCGRENRQGKRSLKLLDNPEETEGGESEDPESSEEEEDFLHMRIDSVKQGGEALPMFLEVTVAGVKVKMEVDTGTFVAVMSKAEQLRLFGEVPLSTTEKILRTYAHTE
ncbi:uncharacterized protein [Temnothorax longispinosus]|uniref:uncharacterized protein n=1 Tax=Temnothorax longispinosus TaxID=300112 RepID=UPI003A9A589A